MCFISFFAGTASLGDGSDNFVIVADVGFADLAEVGNFIGSVDPAGAVSGRLY